jgi:DNA (cytosine-5)-methyltransferase 1
MKSIELFSGAGGLALAVHMAGFEHQLLVEADDNAYETLLQNKRNGVIPGVSNWPVVHDWVESTDLGNYGEIDLLAAGIPCQPFSNGGRRRGVEDDRNMFPVFAGALATIRPKAFLLENVNGLINGKMASHMEYIILQLSHPSNVPGDGQTWQEHCEQLRAERVEAADYGVSFRVFNAADYGVPQIRKRVFIVGFRQGLRTSWNFPMPTHSKEALLVKQGKAEKDETKKEAWVTVEAAIDGLPDFGSEAAEAMQHTRISGARRYRGHSGCPLNWPAKSLKAGVHGVGGGENMLRYGNGRVRYFTVRECARLQTFPDTWAFKGAWSTITKQLGNAVPVKLAAAVAKSVRVALENTR